MEWITFYTDWSQTGPHYFYCRGAVWGIIVTLLVIFILFPLAKRLLTTAAPDPAILRQFTNEQIHSEDFRRRYEFEKPQGG